MATKKPSLITRFRQAEKDRDEHKFHAARLEKEVQAKQVEIDGHKKNTAALSDEINAMHTLLDVLPTAPDRRGESEWKDRPCNLRFAAWLAARLA